MATQKHNTRSLLSTRALIITSVAAIIAVVGYGYYTMTRSSVDDFNLDINVKHQTEQPAIKDGVAPIQNPSQ